MRRSKLLLTGLMAVGATFLLSSCKHEKPKFIYMPDMVYSPAIKAQEEGALRLPVKGTVPRGFTRYTYAAADIEAAGRELTNPLARTKKNLIRGQALYNNYCIVCHGPAGEGDGSIVPRFPRPPSLQSDKIIGYPDGKLFHIMTMGQNLMPSYASQILPEERWAIAHYIRALQRSKHPTSEDLKAAAAADAALGITK